MSLSRDQHIETLRRMWRIRKFEEAGIRLYKDGRIPGSYHASIGEEATIVGACMALRDDDMMTGTHRSHGHPIGKGAELDPLMAELMGKETGICKGRGGSMHLADNGVGIIGESAIVGGGIPLATGCGLTARVLQTGQVSLCFFGDGAVNQGTFHESLNMASIWKLPVIYLCENNGYAVTTSVASSHGQPSIALRAAGYGIPGIAVDGQDVLKVYEATSQAVERARRGAGPTLIEAQTYRFDEHQVGLSVPSQPYRTAEEVEFHTSRRDPIQLYVAALAELGLSNADLEAVEDAAAAAVTEAVRFAESSPAPRGEDIFRFLYSDPVH